jgi:hypothetical protein
LALIFFYNARASQIVFPAAKKNRRLKAPQAGFSSFMVK